MAASDAHPVPLKSAIYRVTFPILDADGDLVSGAASLDSEISEDAATFADAATNEATEIATSSGMYFLDIVAADMGGDTVAVIVKTSTVGAKTTPIVLYPQSAANPILVDVEAVSGDATAANNLELFFDGTGYDAANSTVGTVGSLTANADKTGYGLSTAAVDAVWDEDIEAAHGTDATSGFLLRVLGQVISNRTNNPTLDALLGVADTAGKDIEEQIWAEATRILTASTNFNDITTANVNTEVLDVLNTDTFAESSGVPAATATLVAKIGWLATLARNKITQTSTTQTLRNDADSGDVATAAVSDDATTATRAEWV